MHGFLDGRSRLLDGQRIHRAAVAVAQIRMRLLECLQTGSEATAGIGRWIAYYNSDRQHSTFGGRTPDEVYAMQENEEKLAA